MSGGTSQCLTGGLMGFWHSLLFKERVSNDIINEEFISSCSRLSHVELVLNQQSFKTFSPWTINTASDSTYSISFK